MPTITAQTDISPATRAIEAMKRAVIAPMSNTEGIGAGVQESVFVYAGWIRQRFRSASAGDGTWRPLSGAWLAKKRKLVPAPERILYLYGNLYSSLTPGEPGNVFQVERDRILYGTSVSYSRAQQYGVKHGAWTIPARPFLVPATQEVIERCTATMVALWRMEIERCVTSGRLAA